MMYDAKIKFSYEEITNMLKKYYNKVFENKKEYDYKVNAYYFLERYSDSDGDPYTIPSCKADLEITKTAILFGKEYKFSAQSVIKLDDIKKILKEEFLKNGIEFNIVNPHEDSLIFDVQFEEELDSDFVKKLEKIN